MMTRMSNTNKTIPHRFVPLSEIKNETERAEFERLLKALSGRILSVYAESGETRGFDDWWSYANVVAIVWNPEKGAAERITVKSVPGDWDRMASPFAPDASPEIQEAYAKWYAETYLPKNAAFQSKFQVEQRTNELTRQVSQIETNIGRGTIAMVTRGRKVAHGITGKVFWMGPDNYGNVKAGLALTDRKDERGRNTDVVWINSANLTKVLSSEEQAMIGELNAQMSEASTTLKASVEAKFMKEYEAVGSHYSTMEYGRA